MRFALLSLLLLPASALAQTFGPNDLTVEWSGGPQWLVGADAGLRWFGDGADIGQNVGSSLLFDARVPDVVLRFDESLQTQGRSYDAVSREARGPFTFKGAAYDVSDPSSPRRLALALVEDASLGGADGRWLPDGSPSGGGDRLLILASTYDPDGGSAEGSSIPALRVMYGLAARLADGHTLYEGPGEIRFTPAPLRALSSWTSGHGAADVAWAMPPGRSGEVRALDASGTIRATADSQAGRLRVRGLAPDQEAAIRLEYWDGGVLVASGTATVRPLGSKDASGVTTSTSLRPFPLPWHGDLWGYVAPDGTEYALLTGRFDGLSIIDLTAAPEGDPTQVAFVPTAEGANDTKDVKVYDHYAYVINENGPVQIVDLADPTAPRVVGLLDVQPGTKLGGAHNGLVAEGHLWVVGGRNAGGPPGLRAFSLADPTAPTLVGTFNPTHQPSGYYHDIEVRDGVAFAPAIYPGGGVDVLDVSDPSDIRLISTFTYPGAGVHNTCSTEDGSTLYVGDEIGTAGNWTRIFDITDLEDVELVGDIVVDENAVVHNCYVLGDRLYLAHYTEGLRVFDVSEPHAPVEVAHLDTYAPERYGFGGAWTAYPYLPSGKIIVSDIQTGLWVTTLDEAVVATEEAPARSAGLRVRPNPTTGQATLSYEIGATGKAAIVVYDVLGRVVAETAASGDAGAHEARLDVAGLPPGLYLARLRVDGRPEATATFTVAR